MSFNHKLHKLGYLKQDLYKNVYLNDKADVDYSDGDIEEVIFNKLNTLPNDSLKRTSILEEAIVDWPTKYHFTWERVNILKPVDFNKKDTVLELGGGTGILSEYICERVNSLVTIEGTLNRAKSVSARCKNYNNFNIIVANFLELDMINLFGEQAFDKITLIGVLEYVPKFSNENHAIVKLLEICNKLLKPEGELIIAIENKLGLKYLLGYQEDHNGKEYYGPQSFYKKNDATTFSRAELDKKLIQAKFGGLRYFLPFPDYKLPSVIIKDCDDIYTEKGARLVSTLLYDSKSQNYSGKNLKSLHEGRILENFIKNKRLDLISNSFLLIAKKEKIKDDQKPLAYYFSCNRKYEYANEIYFYKQSESIKVLKNWYGHKTNNNIINLIVEGQVASDLIHGELVHICLDDFYLLNEKEKYKTLFTKWIGFLKTHISAHPEKAFDMMPFNTIIDTNDEFHFIDIDEWKTSKSLSVSEVVSRYVISNKSHFEWLLSIKKHKANIFINEVLAYFNLESIDRDEIRYLNELNLFLKEQVYRKPYRPIKQKPNKVGFMNKYLPYRIKKFLKNKK